MRRFIIGLAKKVLISNTVAVAADALFGTPIGEINIFSAWIAAIAYMLQIYYDFSGYSDMAIGLGAYVWISFPGEFPASVCVWERTGVLAEMAYISVYLVQRISVFSFGRNRKGKLRTCLNKIIVFFATGLWHGAN